MSKSKDWMNIIEQKVVVDEPVLSPEQNEKVLSHIASLHDGYKNLYSSMIEFAHGADPHKKRKIHRMIDHVVEKQKELDHFHRHFKK